RLLPTNGRSSAAESNSSTFAPSSSAPRRAYFTAVRVALSARRLPARPMIRISIGSPLIGVTDSVPPAASTRLDLNTQSLGRPVRESGAVTESVRRHSPQVFREPSASRASLLVQSPAEAYRETRKPH